MLLTDELRCFLNLGTSIKTAWGLGILVVLGNVDIGISRRNLPCCIRLLRNADNCFFSFSYLISYLLSSSFSLLSSILYQLSSLLYLDYL